MHKETKEEFDKKFADVFGWISLDNPNEIISGVDMQSIDKQLIAFINSHFTDNRIIEEELELKKDMSDDVLENNTHLEANYEGYNQAKEDLKQSLLNKSK